jgi:hypothetical protein
MCFLSQNISDCDFSQGGVKKLFFANYNNFVWGNIIFNIHKTLVEDILIDFAWYELDTNSDGVDFQENELQSEQGKLLEHIINWQIQKMEVAKTLPLRNLRNGKFIAIHQDWNDKYWISGLETPYRAKEYKATTGQLKGDNSYSMVFRSLSEYQVFEVGSTYIQEKVMPNLELAEYDLLEYSEEYKI